MLSDLFFISLSGGKKYGRAEKFSVTSIFYGSVRPREKYRPSAVFVKLNPKKNLCVLSMQILSEDSLLFCIKSLVQAEYGF